MGWFVNLFSTNNNMNFLYDSMVFFYIIIMMIFDDDDNILLFYKRQEYKMIGNDVEIGKCWLQYLLQKY